MGLLHSIPSALWDNSIKRAAAGVGSSFSGLYIGKSSSRRSRRFVFAPALAAPSSATFRAARLFDVLAIDPPRPTIVIILANPHLRAPLLLYICAEQSDTELGTDKPIHLAPSVCILHRGERSSVEAGKSLERRTGSPAQEHGSDVTGRGLNSARWNSQKADATTQHRLILVV